MPNAWALFTKMSIAPNWLIVAATTASICARALTSHASATAVPPLAMIVETTSSIGPIDRDVATTWPLAR